MVDEVLADVVAVTKTFAGGARAAIDAMSFRVYAGRVTGLVGPDGAGKTTLMRLLDGLLRVDAGHILVCGFDAAGPLDGIRRAVSYMPQRFGLYEDLTVLENLNLYSNLHGIVGVERQRSYDRLLSFTGLAPFTGRLAGQLSGGMKQKLGLACALIPKPRLMLLDEPSVGVDPISRRELWQMVYDLVEEGIGVVWSTAYLDEAERCATVLLLNEGHVLYDGPPRELTARVAGRTYLAQNLGDRRRHALAQALKNQDVIDGVIQGSSVRLVMAPNRPPPKVSMLRVESAEIVPTPPRFEDAFVDLLGGGPRRESQFAGPPAAAGASHEAIVDVRGLTRRFGDFTAVDGISFQIRRGEIFGLLGPNGAGKSTTFRMMCGLLRPTAGFARVAGADLYRSGAIARRRLGYMAQKFSLYGDLSVRQNLDFFAGVYGLPRAQRHQVIQRMIEVFGLAPFLDRNASELALGFKQRLSLACAVMHDPAVLFLDEPTSGVDPLTRREFWSHINAMVERGVTVTVTTHFLDEAEYCDRIGLIYQGHVIAEGSPEQLKGSVRRADRSDPSLEDAFIELVESYDQRKEAS